MVFLWGGARGGAGHGWYLIPGLETGRVQSAGRNGELYAYDMRMLFVMRIILENGTLKMDSYQALREGGCQPVGSPLTEARAR